MTPILTILLFIFLTFIHPSKIFSEKEKFSEKILICGVCQNVEKYFECTKRNIEALGSLFADYAVIIYENNSSDNTFKLYVDWAIANPKVIFMSENMHPLDLPRTRIEKIARARNLVLKEARKTKYSDFPYLIMADLDFIEDWPIDEIVHSIHLPIEWDCISANGTREINSCYYDRYAFRDMTLCLGPELIDNFRTEYDATQFQLNGEELVPVFSAFGGLAIYKTATLLKFHYSGIVTEDLSNFYHQIFLSVPETNTQLQRYLAINEIKTVREASMCDVSYRCEFAENIINCCEHVTLHASMHIKGYNKFFVNPKMRMYYYN